MKKFQKGEHVLVLHGKRDFEAVVHKILMDEGKMILKARIFGKETDVVTSPLRVQKSKKHGIEDTPES